MPHLLPLSPYLSLSLSLSFPLSCPRPTRRWPPISLSLSSPSLSRRWCPTVGTSLSLSLTHSLHLSRHHPSPHRLTPSIIGLFPLSLSLFPVGSYRLALLCPCCCHCHTLYLPLSHCPIVAIVVSFFLFSFLVFVWKTRFLNVNVDFILDRLGLMKLDSSCLFGDIDWIFRACLVNLTVRLELIVTWNSWVSC